MVIFEVLRLSVRLQGRPKKLLLLKEIYNRNTLIATSNIIISLVNQKGGVGKVICGASILPADAAFAAATLLRFSSRYLVQSV